MCNNTVAGFSFEKKCVALFIKKEDYITPQLSGWTQHPVRSIAYLFITTYLIP
jgi:hypothetical protein